MAQEATIENFDEMIQGPLTVVDFWAPWCGPCKMMEPIMAELEKEFAGQIKFVKFNVDHQQAIAERYKVMSVPSLVLFRDGVFHRGGQLALHLRERPGAIEQERPSVFDAVGHGVARDVRRVVAGRKVRRVD